jgi:hypothetical protein
MQTKNTINDPLNVPSLCLQDEDWSYLLNQPLLLNDDSFGSANNLTRSTSEFSNNSGRRTTASSTVSFLTGNSRERIRNRRDDGWRRLGKALRKQLVTQDEADEGGSIKLNNECSILRYYQVSEKVSLTSE